MKKQTKPKQSKLTDDLTEDWKKIYDKESGDPLLEEADFESLCIGWCLAKGLSLEDGFDFYQRMIKLGYF